MQRLLLSFFALALISSACNAQTPAPPTAPTIKTNTRLVIVDVTVTDKNQVPVRNLKQSDFTLLEDNSPQQIRHFEEHAAPPATKFQPLPAMPPGIFTNYTTAPPNGALFILLLDALNTPVRDQNYTLDQLEKYLNAAPPGVRIAVFGLTTRLTLQGFNSDPEILKAALRQRKSSPSSLLNDQITRGDAPETASEILDENIGDMPGLANVVANLHQFEAQQQSFQDQLRAKYTLDAMNQLARYLANLPGRKNLIWFSGSFPINILPDESLKDPFAVVASAEDEFRETTNLLSLAQVAVYPVDARGLMTDPSLSAAVPGNKYARRPTAYGNDQTKFFLQTANEHATMQGMAQQTGGRSFTNNNDLSKAVAQAVADGSSYYTLAYSPSSTNWNGKFRKIQVKLQQEGLALAYRRGYYADDPSAPPKHDQLAATTPPSDTPIVAMRTAMAHGAPTPSQILMKLRVLPASAATEDAVAPDNKPNPAFKSGPYRRYIIDVAADPHPMLFRLTPDGVVHGSLQFLAWVYDQDGNLVNATGDSYRTTFPKADYDRFLKTGLPWHQEISVPAKGTYYLRIGVHDRDGDRVGAVEIPVNTVKNLAPLPAPATTTASPPVAPK